MIAKECAPSAKREQENLGQPKCSASSYLKVSIEEKICSFLLNRRGWISTRRLFENLNVDFHEMLNCLNRLVKTGYIDKKSNALRANKRTKEITSLSHTTEEIYRGVCDIIRYYEDNNCESAATEIQTVLDKAGNPQNWTQDTKKQMIVYCSMWPEVTGWGEGE